MNAPKFVTSTIQKVKSAFANNTTNAIFGGQTIPSGPNMTTEVNSGIPERVKARMSGWGEPPNLSSVTCDIGKIQAAIRMAERGDTYQLFTIYRDLVLGCSHIQAEWAKRKMVVAGQPYAIQPVDKKNVQDVQAVEACKQMVEGCENWDEGILQLLDATLYPCAVVEKIYQPFVPVGADISPLRYGLKRLEPVNYALYCYKIPYLAMGGASPTAGIAPQVNGALAGNPAVQWNPDDWEPDLRFYDTFQNGLINFSYASVYKPDPSRHIVHRANILTGIRDNFGGPMRSVMFWWYFSIQGRDWWARLMERYGSPFMVAKANVQNKDTINFLQEAFSLATKIGGIVIDSKAQLDLKECNTAGLAEGFDLFFNVCNAEISKIVLGQTLSAKPEATGMGSGVADLQGDVRDDIRQFDQKMLCNTIKRQLFKPFLELNGIPGNAPNIVWGGLDEKKAQSTAETLSKLSAAGLKPCEDSMEGISERLGFKVEMKPEPEPQTNGQPGTPRN